MRNPFARRDRDKELKEEIQGHLSLAAREEMESGKKSIDAEIAAHRELGNEIRVRELTRESWGWRWLENLAQDVRYGVRNMIRTPGFMAITGLTLAVGIGATTAIFSAVNPILFESLPYPHANRIMMIWETSSDRSRVHGSFGMFLGLAERSRAFESIAALNPWQPTVTGTDQPQRLEGQRVSASFFQVLGVSPIVGRDFVASDDRLNAPNVVILSYALWKRHFGGDGSIVGRQITLEEADSSSTTDSYTVIGIMPGNFENVLAPSAELWAPLQYDISQGRAWGHFLRTVGRLKEGVSEKQAIEELNESGTAVVKEQHPPTYRGVVKFTVNSLEDEVTRGVKPALLAILGAVLLVLGIAWANVTNLLVARGVRRRGEFALRAALGAGRSRLIRQVLTESLLVAVVGGALGMALAILGVHALVTLSPADLPRGGAIGVDGAVFAFGFGMTALIGLAFGLMPAFHAARFDPQRDLQQGSRRANGGHRRTRSALVIAEVAVALVLLIGSGLLFRSMERLFAIPAGFNATNVLAMQVEEVGHRYDEDSAKNRFFARALEAVRRVPGVAIAGFTSQLPLSGDFDVYGVTLEGDHNLTQGEEAFRYAVTPGYLEAMAIPLKRGRLLEDHDGAGVPPVALINESFAKRKFPGQDPIGQRIHVGRTDLPWYTIVGVVGDVKQMSLAMSESDAVYVTPAQWYSPDSAMSLVVRAHGDATALVPAIRQAIWSVDKDQPVARAATMDELLVKSAAERRFSLILFEAFALAALVLAAAGIYGVLSGSVAERTREIGLRAALGASRGNILALILRQGMTLTGLGIAIGLAGAVWATQALTTLLFGISPLDPITYIGVIALLTGVSLVACAVPAWRAVRIDPASTLRAE